MDVCPLDWPRGRRSAFSLGADRGVYALFLRKGAILHGCTPGPDGLIYIGKATGQGGLKRRCHFHGKTRNHSPRKSLAVLLRDMLALAPIPIHKPNSSDSWGLDSSSEVRLSEWMHANLEYAMMVCDDPDRYEALLIARFAPPLNLTGCVRTTEHLRISQLREQVQASFRLLATEQERNPCPRS